MEKARYKKIFLKIKAWQVFLFLFLLILLTGCASKTTRFKKPDIKDAFCGPVMDYRYCKCAFHNEFCDNVGISSATANSYVRSEYNRWIAFLLKKFEKDCKEGGGIFHPKYECEHCQFPAIKKGNKCVDPNKENADEEKSKESGFKPDGPLDSSCNTTPEFENEWKKYSDIDARIPVQSRSWEAQGIVRTHERI